MTIITIGIDLAKNIFAVHGVNESGHATLVKTRAAAISSCRSSLFVVSQSFTFLHNWRCATGN